MCRKFTCCTPHPTACGGRWNRGDSTPTPRDNHPTGRLKTQGLIQNRNFLFKCPRWSKPVRKINRTLILEEWPNIERILLSLALKTTTQSLIVGKLSAFARRNKTRQALWEYDHILQSLYLLNYIDSPPLRRNVQQALNRGENYHQLRRAVSYANFGKLRFKTEYEQQLWGECARLITNALIYYNATILSNLLEHRGRNRGVQGAALLKQVSPVAWQHVNFYGRYEFNQSLETIDMKAIIQELAHVSIEQEKAL